MFFSWFKNRSRERIRNAPFPANWLDLLSANLWQYKKLTSNEKVTLHATIAILVAEKNWEGCNGFQINDDVKVMVAAQVALMTLYLGEEYFDLVQSILVYPAAYRAVSTSAAGDGLVIEGESDRLGEAWYRGPVILSYSDIMEAARSKNHGRNLVIHEFAHQIDMLNGRNADGIPPMNGDEEAEKWIDCLNRTYTKLVHDFRHGLPTLIDEYGATNKAECFAVLSETFFQRPDQIIRGDQEMFDALCGYYRQNPIRWTE